MINPSSGKSFAKKTFIFIFEQEALDREKKRIEDGKKMTEIKQEMANKEMIRAAEERRREKLETLAAKEKIKLQIQVN